MLILAGGIVRASGSGMGCPDWPKCFGKLIPPTKESELPVGYKQTFLNKRLKKNERVARIAAGLGFAEFAKKLRNDSSGDRVESFNVINTYTEYINRLIGALTGIIFLLTWVQAARIRSGSLLTVYSTALILILVQAWLGSLVVSSNLLGFLISLHMFVALVILALAVFGRVLVLNERPVRGKMFSQVPTYFLPLALVTLGVTGFQLLLGTHLREAIDLVSTEYPLRRASWIVQTGAAFVQHREFAWVVIAGHVAVFYTLLRYGAGLKAYFSIWLIPVLLFLQVVAGIVLAKTALLPFAQVAHVFLASVLFGNLAHIVFTAGFFRAAAKHLGRAATL